MLKEARKLARTLPPEKRAAIEEMCNEIEALMKELADLQARGLVRGREGGWWRGEEEWKDRRDKLHKDSATRSHVQWNPSNDTINTDESVISEVS